MIVIEGLDGSGKSTLAKRLAKDLEIPYFHHGAPTESFAEFWEKCNNSAILFQRPIVQDRTPIISEYIYGKFRNREQFIDLQKSQDWIRESLIVLIYCRPERYIESTVKSYDTKSYMEWLRRNLIKIQAEYDCYMAQMHAIRYDWTRIGFEQIVYNGILDLCKKRLIHLQALPNVE